MIFSAVLFRRFVLIVLLSILTACQAFSNGSTESNIENPESQTLKLLTGTKDIPGKWSWVFVKIQQPSQAKWIDQENLSDSAESVLKGNYSFDGQKHYISIFHNIAQYSVPLSEAEPFPLSSVFDGSSSIDLPSLQTFGNKTEAACFASKNFYDCTVVETYESTKSFLTVIVPKELGVQELENLLNSILKANNDKIKDVEQK